LRRNFLVKHVTEWKKEVTGRRGRRCKQIPVDLKEIKGYWKLKEETIDCTPYSTCLASSCGPVVR
jgi:hypothetical protein